jgi:uncharacterized protein
MRIDAHVHYLPPMDAEALRAYQARDPYWGLLISPPTGRSIQGFADVEHMLADMDRAGIDRVVIQGEYHRQHSACQARNDVAMRLVQQHPDRFSAFATIQPLAGAAALDELQRCLDGGLQGVGELNPYAQGFTFHQPDFLRLVEALIRADAPLNLHVSEEVGHTYAGKSTTPLREYYWLAGEYPALKLILAHWGGGLLFHEIVPLVRRTLRNVWYDTAASPLLYPTADIFALALQAVDWRKILFGSDYPLLLYPGRQQEPDFVPFLQEIAALGLAAEVSDGIMGRNMARLLGLAADDVPTAATHVPRSQAAPSGVIGPMTSVRYAAERWPETQAVFDRHGIPWIDQPVPYWEPVLQAAAARGMGSAEQEALLDELNEAVG